MTLPGKVSGAGLGEAGAVWVRRTFTVTPTMAIGPLFIELGVLRDFDALYIDGNKVGEQLRKLRAALRLGFTTWKRRNPVKSRSPFGLSLRRAAQR